MFPINPCPINLSSSSYPPSHTSFSSPTSPEFPPTFFARILSFLMVPPQPYPRRIDCTQISPPTLSASICTGLHLLVALFPRYPLAVGGTSSHTVCVCGRGVVNICQVGHRGWRAGGIERGGSDAGHWLEGRQEEYGREMERRTVD